MKRLFSILLCLILALGMFTAGFADEDEHERCGPSCEYDLTINHIGEGTTSPPEGEHTYTRCQEVTINAAADDCWEFVEWRGDINSTDPTVTFYISSDMEVTAVFEQIEYELEVTHSGEGVTIPSGASTRLCGEVVEIAAKAAPCWEFVGWRGPVASSGSAVTTVTITEDTRVHAVFEKIQYNLGVSHEGYGTTTPEGVTTWDCGTIVKLSAVADECYRFDRWEGDVASPSSAMTTTTMYESKRIRAIFVYVCTPETVSLGISVEGYGSTIPTPGTHQYPIDEVVKLTAIPDDCWAFDHWEGDVASSGSAVTTVTMDEPKRVRAVFVEGPCPCEKVELYLYVYEGHGEVSPAGTTEHCIGTEEAIFATPDPGWEFVTWRGGDGQITSWTTTESSVIMDQSTTVAAIFAPIATPGDCTLTVTHEGDGYTIPSGATVVSCGTVDLKAYADEGWAFKYWTGAPVADMYDPMTTITVTTDSAVHAVFEDQYVLNIEIEGNGDTDPAEGNNYYAVTSPAVVVDLETDPDSGWYFYRWEGPDAGDISSGEIVMDEDKELVAVFRRRTSSSSFGGIFIQHTLSITVEGNGTVDPFVGSKKYTPGTTVDLSVDPAVGWTFVGWFGPDGDEVVNEQIEMDDDKTLIARFEGSSPPVEPPVQPPEIVIPLVETPLGGGDLPDTSQAIPWMNLVLGFFLCGIGYKNKKK